MAEFVFPSKPEQLLEPDCESSLCVVTEVNVAEMAPEETEHLVEELCYDICEHDPLCVGEQQFFDRVFGLIRGFTRLQPVARRRLIDSLVSNLSVLSACVDSALGSDAETLLRHRTALKLYVFFLHWPLAQAEAEARDGGVMVPPAAAAAKGRGRKKAGGDAATLGWDWDQQRGVIAKGLSGVAEVDLVRLWQPEPVEDAFVQRWLQTAYLMLDNPNAAVMRDSAVSDAATRILSAGALRFGQLESVTNQLFNLLNKHEHLAGPVAALAAQPALRGDDSRLAVELLRAVASVDPREYEAQMTRTAAAVRTVGAFIAELAERVPRTVAAHVALLVPHLGCDAYPIRSGIATAIGHLLAGAFEQGGRDGADSQGSHARLRSMQTLLDTLMARARDKTSWTRACVCRTWGVLAEGGKVPMGHWNAVAEVAIGRMEDKSSNVRKAAMQLVMTLLQYNPFGPVLDEPRLVATLSAHAAKLQEVAPAQDDTGDSAEWAPAAGPAAAEHADAGGSAEAVKAEAPHSAASTGADPAEAEPSAGEAGVSANASMADAVPAEDSAVTSAEEAAPSTRLIAGDGIGARMTVEQLRTVVASLRTAVEFSRALAGAMPALSQLLASSTLTDVQEAIAVLMACRRFGIHGADATIRKMLPLVFSRDPAIKDAVVTALDQLYLQTEDPLAAASNLAGLAAGATVGELGSLEEVVVHLMRGELISHMTIKALWSHADRAFGDVTAAGDDSAARQDAQRRLRSSLAVLAMVAAGKPDEVLDRLPLLLKVGFSRSVNDALVSRHACTALQRLAPAVTDLDAPVLHAAYKALLGCVMTSRLPESDWYTAAEAAITAIYALHPTPQGIMTVVVRWFAKAGLRGDAAMGIGADAEGSPQPDAAAASAPAPDVPAARLSRLFFVVGQVALQHLVLVERQARAVRRQRADAEKAAAETRSERLAAGATQPADDAPQEDINAELGVGAVAADLELDSTKEAAEAQIVAASGALGRYAPLIAAFCRSNALMAVDARLRSSTLLALTKLMAVDAGFCEANLRLAFTLLHNKTVEPAVRSNLVIAIGDLAFRFPNLLEPWTPHMYRSLADSDIGVRKNALMVLTHLILNDMMKVKGQIARIARCLQDSEPRIAGLAHLFFEELSHKVTKNVNPIYNLLPDILSSLSADADLPPEQFQAIMHTLLDYIKKDRLADALVEKLCLRFDAGGEDKSQSRNLAFCLAQLSISEKGFKKMVELHKHYKDQLLDPDVLASFQTILDKFKKREKRGDAREAVADLEARLAEVAAQLAEAAEKLAAAQGEAKPDVKPDISGLKRIAEAEDGDAQLDNPGAAGPELSEDATSLRRGMARVKLEHGEASEATADDDDGDAAPLALEAAPAAVKAEPDAEAAAGDATAASKSVASAAQRSESAPQAAPSRSRRSSRVTVKQESQDDATSAPSAPVTVKSTRRAASTGTRKPRRGSQAKRGESAVEQEVDDAEYADQNEDSSNVPTAEPRDQKNGKGRRKAATSVASSEDTSGSQQAAGPSRKSVSCMKTRFEALAVQDGQQD